MASVDETRTASVAIKIGGREYRLRTDGDPARLQAVASYVERELREQQASTPDTQDAAILTALNVASELLEIRDHLSVVPRERVKALIELIDSAST